MQATPSPITVIVAPKKRVRIPISCTECRKSKKRCNQTKDRPCSNCSRRYPPVICSYDYPEKLNKLDEDHVAEEYAKNPNQDVNSFGINAADFRVEDGPIIIPHAPFMLANRDIPSENEFMQMPQKALAYRHVTTDASLPRGDQEGYPEVAERASNDMPSSSSIGAEPSASNAHRALALHQQKKKSGSSRGNSSMRSMTQQSQNPEQATSTQSLISVLKQNQSLLSSGVFRANGGENQNRHLEENGKTFFWNPYLLPRKGRTTYGCPEAFDSRILSPLILQPFQPIPIENTIRNRELFHFFHQILGPSIGAIDGENQPASLRNNCLPWMRSSPLMAYTALLSASCYQAEARGLDATKFPEAIAVKGKIIKIITQGLKETSMAVSDEMISAVMHLALNESLHGDKKSQLAHMSGLREMIRLRGGIQSFIYDPSLYTLLVMADYQVACTCERDLTFTPPTDPIPIPSSYPVHMESPLFRSNLTFHSLTETLEISAATAAILDDMRFLTTAVINLPAHNPEVEVEKLVKTAKWIHDRTAASPSIMEPPSPLAGDFIYECCRMAAKVYTKAIMTRTPLSKSCGIQEIMAFWGVMPQISLTRWKTISGIFLWICAVLCPGAQWTMFGRFLKFLVSNLITDIGLNKWDVMVGCVGGILRVHNWLKEKGGTLLLQ